MAEFSLRLGYPVNEKNPEGRPLPKQSEFHKDRNEKKYRLIAGGFGTGKTLSLCLEVIKEAVAINNNYILLGRKDLGELKSTTLKELLDLLPEILIEDHNKQERTIRLANGSEIYYMNLDDSREATEKIKSLNLGSAAIDQLEEIEETVFLAIKGRLRRHNTSRNFFATCNPAGHDWVWKTWKELQYEDYLILNKIELNKANEICKTLDEKISKAEPEKIENVYVETAEEEKFEFEIIKTLHNKSQYKLYESITIDNHYLPHDYIRELLAYPKRWVKRFVYCSWDEFEGLVYNEFVEAKHVIDSYSPSASEAHYIILDYGFRNPCAVLYAATDYDGVTRIYDEYYKPEQLISTISADIKKSKFFNRANLIADPSTKKTERDGKSVAYEFQQNDIFFQDADNDVLQGINRVNELFKVEKLLICRNCVNTLSEIGNYKWKEIRPGQQRNEFEEPIKKNDHAMDCIRYLANEIYKPAELPSDAPKWLKKLKQKSILNTKPYILR